MRKFIWFSLFVATAQFAASDTSSLAVVLPLSYIERQQWQAETLRDMFASQYFAGRADAFRELAELTRSFQ